VERVLELVAQREHIVRHELVVAHHPDQQVGLVLEALLREVADVGGVPADVARVDDLDRAAGQHRARAQAQPVGEAADLVGQPLDARLAEHEDAPAVGRLVAQEERQLLGRLPVVAREDAVEAGRLALDLAGDPVGAVVLETGVTGHAHAGQGEDALEQDQEQERRAHDHAEPDQPASHHRRPGR
jgi:hypothetical protein